MSVHRVSRPPTLLDVAAKAGVSRATVSRVLNKYPHVHPEVRQRVLKATKVLRYRPDRVAQSLVRRETRTIGLVVADITNPFYAETAKAIVETARGRGYTVVLCNTENLPRLQAEQIEVLREQRVDGIILGSVHLQDPPVEHLVATGFPCVMYNRRLRSGAGNYVVLDNVRGAEEATQHFIALGHRRIAFVAGPRSFSTASERLVGYRRALRAARIPWDPRLVRQGQFQPALAFQAAVDLLKGAPRPTAIVAGNDLTALAVLDAAADLGIRVPDDLAVSGFDDTDIARHRRIQLTSVAQQKAEMGRLAVTYLLECIQDPDRFRRDPIRHILLPTLVVRRSSGAVIASGRSGRARSEGEAATTRAGAAAGGGSAVPRGREP